MINLMSALPDFDRPIEALYICHSNILKRMERMEEMGEVLMRDGAAAFDAQRETWLELSSFIRHSIPNHTADEENDLFPLLREGMGSEIEGLFADHREAEAREERLQMLIASLADGGLANRDEAVAELGGLAVGIAEFYRDHIRLENEEIFPRAAELLDETQLRTLGDEMRKRRKIAVTV
jgi:hemerythrin-like domain-containing protein